MTWRQLAIAAGCADDMEFIDFALWNLTAFPFADARTVWYQLRHVLRLAERAGHWPEAPDGGFR